MGRYLDLFAVDVYDLAPIGVYDRNAFDRAHLVLAGVRKMDMAMDPQGGRNAFHEIAEAFKSLVTPILLVVNVQNWCMRYDNDIARRKTQHFLLEAVPAYTPFHPGNDFRHLLFSELVFSPVIP